MPYYTVAYRLGREPRHYDLFFLALRHVEIARPRPYTPPESWYVRTRETRAGLAARLRALIGPLDRVEVTDAEAPKPMRTSPTATGAQTESG